MTLVQTEARLLAVTAEGAYRRVRLDVPELAVRLTPGQSVTANVGDVLRRPLLPAALDARTLDLLLPPDHPIAALNPGQLVDLLGPLGRPLYLRQPAARLLLVADEAHLPSLLPPVHQALVGGGLATLLLFTSATPLYPLSFLPPALEIQTVPLDGSADVPLDEFIQWADQILAAASPALYGVLAQAVRSARLSPGPGFVQAVFLAGIVCGVGACQGCAIATRQGYRRVCSDGPFFDLLEVEVT